MQSIQREIPIYNFPFTLYLKQFCAFLNVLMRLLLSSGKTRKGVKYHREKDLLVERSKPGVTWQHVDE